MGESSQEKTEEATPKRLRDARKKGDIAKSKDLIMVIVMIVVFATMAFTMGFMSSEIQALMKDAFLLVANDPIDPAEIMEIGKCSLVVLLKVIAPILIAGSAAALLVGFLQAGGIFTTDPLIPKFEKLNPIEGFKNIFKMQTLIELVKNLAKLTIVLYLAYATIDKFMESILLSSQVTLIEASKFTGSIVYSFFMKVALIFLVIAVIDMGVQRWNYMKRHRMSKDEVKREYKQDEGDPHIKGERKRLHREMVFGDVKKNVKNADAVVSNPIHVAVAIKYDRQEMAAPEVLTKGQRQYAEMILQIAREERVPIIRNIPLAWSLLQVDEGDAIPEDLYEPVAEVLTLVYEMREGNAGASTQASPESPTSAQDKKPTSFNPLA